VSRGESLYSFESKGRIKTTYRTSVGTPAMANDITVITRLSSEYDRLGQFSVVLYRFGLAEPISIRQFSFAILVRLCRTLPKCQFICYYISSVKPNPSFRSVS
jgi:hypothetical protein